MNDNTAVATSVDTPAVADATPAAPKRKAGRPFDPNSLIAQAKAAYKVGIDAGQSREEIINVFLTLKDSKGKKLNDGSANIYYFEASAVHGPNPNKTRKVAVRQPKATAPVDATETTVVASDEVTG